ncbi:DUF488 domain-containing protein [Halosaccharopolyspora lacisalsi]|uniref:DUF488 domain-containing protein n=1 Tax=Halosaccharopolyspora lacisalsi TaxID=1000566 RepID=UPI002E28BF1A|nr:DUF488 domain-containing protein [Halosaccharopolyspora lacisalsi]
MTVGHGTASLEDLVGLLGRVEMEAVIDVRSAPGSRRNPRFARSVLENELPRRGLGYRWDERLGGFRSLPPDSPDWVWRNEGFRAYAAHMRTERFRDGVAALLSEVSRYGCAVMCSESLWWRCHRRLIADHVQLVHGIAVRHLMHDGRVIEHRPVEGVRVRDDGLLVYDAGRQRPGDE